MVESDLNMFSLMESLHKIKATLSVLVGQDKCKLDQIQQLYAKQTTIIPNHPSSINTEYSEYLEFLQRDEREKIEKYEAEAHHHCCEIDFKVLPKEKIEEKQIIQNEIDLKITIDLEKKSQEEEQKDEQKKSSIQQASEENSIEHYDTEKRGLVMNQDAIFSNSTSTPITPSRNTPD